MKHRYRTTTSMFRLTAIILLSAVPLMSSAGTLVLAGKIAPSLSYNLQLDYKTSVNTQQCQYQDYITGMWIPLTQVLDLPAGKVTHRHLTNIPTTPPDVEGSCQWQLSTLSLCPINRASQRPLGNCQAIFLQQQAGEKSVQAHTINCSLKNGVCEGDSNTPLRVSADFTAEQLELNILQSSQ